MPNTCVKSCVGVLLQDTSPVPSTVTEMPSVGSHGHPEFCRRPCVHFIKRRCVEGSACGYCHMLEHPKAIALDKHQRVLMTSLRDADKVRLLLPPLQEKAHRGLFGQRGAWHFAGTRHKLGNSTVTDTAPQICAKMIDQKRFQQMGTH